ncbi:MAG: glycosyltransferase family 2 protein [Bacteroidales bacterium]|nr:glycosyltransferase family 2 protein [Bacteroidales bacterium]
MKLSVVIVNYKVKYFTFQLLDSLFKALKGVDSEVIVVDNNSEDDSVDYLKKNFPGVLYLPLSENVGFGKANNIAISKTNSDYVLLINPDTFVSEGLINKVLEFMDENPICGCCGVRLVDSLGNYLPESKRSFPSVKYSFFKLTGISSFLPNSKLFSGYSLGNLDKDAVNQVEILPGAFMMIRRKTLEKSGTFDERFFMYGEDIDLSFRLNNSGYKNYYLPYTLIHYKGESSRQNSKRYINSFYDAMQVFVNKYNDKVCAGIFIGWSINLLRQLSLLKVCFKKAVKKYLFFKNKNTLKILIPSEYENDKNIIDYFLLSYKNAKVEFAAYSNEYDLKCKLLNGSFTNAVCKADSYSEITEHIESSSGNISFSIYHRESGLIVSSNKCAIINN